MGRESKVIIGFTIEYLRLDAYNEPHRRVARMVHDVRASYKKYMS